jgi:membrane fusion protein, multidrug efflux system
VDAAKRVPLTLGVSDQRLRALRLLVALSAICLATGCSRPEQTRSEAARPVKTMLVTAANQPLVRTFPGKVEASKSVELAFQVPGLLVKLPV